MPECQKVGLKSQGWAGTKSPGIRRGRIRSQPVRSINKVIVLAGRKSRSLPDPLLSRSFRPTFPGDILESSPTSTNPLAPTTTLESATTLAVPIHRVAV